MSLPKLAKQPVGLASFESLWDSPLLQAEVELQAASHEERGVMAMRLMSALASQPSPFQSLMSRCIEALRPCVFAQDAAQAAHTPGAAAAEAAGGEGPTHVAMSAKLREEMRELKLQASSSREAFEQTKALLLAEHDKHAACRLALAAAEEEGRRQAEAGARLRAQLEHAQAALDLLREQFAVARRRGEAQAEEERLAVERLLEDSIEGRWHDRRKFSELQAEMKECITREEFNDLAERHRKTLQQLALTKAEHMAMREAMKEMQQEVEEVRRTAADERRRLKAEVAAGTPRPDWGRLQLVAGGALTAGLRQKQEAEHKAQMTQGVRDGGAGPNSPGKDRKKKELPTDSAKLLERLRSSQERTAAVGAALVHLWQQQRDASAYIPAQGPFFESMGVGSDVPVYLRWSGKRLLNKRWPKREAERMIEDIWAKKKDNNKMRDNAGKQHLRMDEYLLMYMQQTYGLEHLVAENTYNFIDACKRNVYDSDMAVFLAVLHGRTHEEEQLEQQAELDHLRREINSLEPAEKILSRQTTVGLLPRLFPTRRMAQLEELKDALLRSIMQLEEGRGTKEPKEFKLTVLLDSDAEGTQSPFAECIRHQHLKEPSLYMQEMQGQITNALLTDRGDIAKNTLPIEVMSEIIRGIDPGRPDEEVFALLSVGMGCKDSEVRARLRKKESLELEPFCARLDVYRPRYSNRVARAGGSSVRQLLNGDADPQHNPALEGPASPAKPTVEA